MKRINEIFTTKRKLCLVVYLFIFIFLISCIKSVQYVKADSNYSNYLTSESIDVKNDRALILLEESGSSNNYRNYYETGFLFPSKLRTEMYSTDLTTNPSKYYVQQAYLDDLDSEYAFSDVENLGQYETNNFVDNYIDIIENIGYYENTVNNSYHILIPNSDISNTANVDSSPFYAKIDEYPEASTVDKIYYYNNDISYVVLGLNNSNDVIYDKFEIYLYNQYNRQHMFISLTDNGTFIDYYQIDDSYSGAYEWDLLIINQTINNPENLQLQVYHEYCTPDNYFYLATLYIKAYFNTTYILENNDYNSYNYMSNGSGTEGVFLSEYSFDSDITPFSDSSGSGCSTTWTDEISNHKGLLKLTDNSAGAFASAEAPISDIAFGTFEYYVYTNDVNKYTYFKIFDDSNAMVHFRIGGAQVHYYDGGWIRIGSIVPVLNTWYHILFDFECTSGSYKGLNQYRFQIEWDGVSYGAYAFDINRPHIDEISVYTHTTNTAYISYYDALDVSWSDGYFKNRNLLDSAYSLNITSNLTVNREGNSFDNLEALDLEYTIKANDSCNLDLYIYNIFSNEYDLINTESITTNFQDFSYSYDLNYTYYNSLGFTDFMFYYESNPNILFSFDKINLNAIFSNFSLNNDGFHNVNLKFNRETSGTINRGNISFNLQLYQNYFTYNYIENNVIESDYERLNQLVNFSNEVEQIYEVEIQYHIRYGLNTLDIDIVNTYIMVIINYNFTFELFEQLRFGNNDGNYFRAEFSYDSMNFNRLNLTGIYGNYSMNCLSGLRVLRADTTQNFNRYFTIPYFDEKISLSYTSGVHTSGSGSEPRLPSSEYWTYESFRLADSGNFIITVENWSVDFRSVEAEIYTAKYPYKSKTIRRSDLGNWKFTVLEQKVSFNFLRNAIADILNLVFLFFQYLGFYVLSGLSYVIMYIGINILVLLWNIIIYWIFVALIWIFWYVYSGLVWLLNGFWDLLLYIYETVLIPAYIWITEVAVPYLVEFVIIPAIAFTLTLIIWIITLGRLDFWELYEVVETQLYVLSDSFNVIMLELVEHIVEVVIFIGLYLLLIGMCYLKHIVVKVRGYVNRSNALEESLNAYLYPLIIFYKICLAIKQLIANWF